MAKTDLYITREIYKEIPTIIDMRLQGATKDDIRQYLNVAKLTMQRWEKNYKAFRDAIRTSTRGLTSKLKQKLYTTALKDKKVTITVKEQIDKKTGKKVKLREVKVEDISNLAALEKALSFLDKEYRTGRINQVEKNTIAGSAAGKLCLDLASIKIPQIEEEVEEVETLDLIDDLSEFEEKGLIQ